MQHAPSIAKRFDLDTQIRNSDDLLLASPCVMLFPCGLVSYLSVSVV